MADAPRDVAPQLNVDDETERYGRFIAEPLENGYGITLGNALRRVLLSSLPGAAITSVRIEQAHHEFSSIEGVVEDTTQLLLALKEIRLQALSDRPGTLALDAEGPGEVTAADIQVPADFEIANPEMHIATLDSKSARLNIELHVEIGKGYVPAGSVEGMPIGVIPVDAIFSPVRKVNYRVEKTRVGQSTNFDRLILEIWTDGTVGPVDALGQAADILMDQFALFSAMGRPEPMVIERSASTSLGMAPDRYNTPIEDLSLSVRAYNCLKRSGLMTVGQVLEKSEDELLSLRNFGRKSYDELRDRLIELGYVDGNAEGLKPIVEAGAGSGDAARIGSPRTSQVILDEDDNEASLGALGKALKEALKEVGEDDLLGADDDD
ncbi:MAG: DNA-directed RNA polymerase subunit alpha [Dehalococcoidia bacterium]|nr:DNA-directed RNA polymerase subunit alpha [Dehalococcoidia bacterium]MCA9844040.1 DNA-directed RNA polymerase subunit alpha [Dehalococcoidia bacterium]MCA9854334.1 DNA-directed RNA polymerase subunit alpha [Dehalococcoidia bacterium]